MSDFPDDECDGEGDRVDTGIRDEDADTDHKRRLKECMSLLSIFTPLHYTYSRTPRIAHCSAEQIERMLGECKQVQSRLQLLRGTAALRDSHDVSLPYEIWNLNYRCESLLLSEKESERAEFLNSQTFAAIVDYIDRTIHSMIEKCQQVVAVQRLCNAACKLGSSAEWVRLWCAAAALFPSAYELAIEAQRTFGLFPPSVSLAPKLSVFSHSTDCVVWEDKSGSKAGYQYRWISSPSPSSSLRVGVRYPYDEKHMQLMRNQIEAWSVQDLGDIVVIVPSAWDPNWYVFVPKLAENRSWVLSDLQTLQSHKGKGEDVTPQQLQRALRRCAQDVVSSLRSASARGISLESVHWATAGILGPGVFVDGHHQGVHSEEEKKATAAVTAATAVFWGTMRSAFRDCSELWSEFPGTRARQLETILGLMADPPADRARFVKDKQEFEDEAKGTGGDADGDADEAMEKELHLFSSLIRLFLQEEQEEQEEQKPETQRPDKTPDQDNIGFFA